jgi:uncharacterized protein YlzI (FlbEa/FlbD family)
MVERVICLTQMVDRGPRVDDVDIWVNPDHIMTVQTDNDVTVVQMVSGWLFRVREHVDVVTDKMVGGVCR